MIRSTIVAAMLAMLGAAAIPTTWAQAETARAAQSSSYSDSELKSFAAAAVEVHRINSGYLPKMAEAAPDQQRALEQQALRETTAAVEKQGLTSDKYDEILGAAQTRPEVATKVEEFLNKTPRPGTTRL